MCWRITSPNSFAVALAHVTAAIFGLLQGS
jgi:hypothetical protein